MKIILGLVIISLLHVSRCFADTTWVASGSVSGVWGVSGSPYMIDSGDITVGGSSVLTINPGVTIYFTGQFKLVINGQLLAIGTQTDSIRFTGSELNYPQDTPQRWKGLRFINGDAESHLSYCNITYGGATGAGALSNGGGLYSLNSPLHVEHSWIRRCHARGQGCGAFFAGGDVLLEYTDITHNFGTLIDPDMGDVIGDAGGFATANTNIHLRHCKVQLNWAGMNIGAIRFGGGTVATLDTCLIDDNRAYLGGWNGIVADSTADISMTNTTISNHNYPAFGATSGLRCIGVTLTMEACTLRNNPAWYGIEPIPTEGGSALMVRNPPFAHIRNTVFEGNQGQYGGAVLCDHTSFERCTFLNNISTNGAVFSNGSNHFTDCTFEGNAAALAYISPWSYYGDGVGGALAFVSGVDTVQNCRFIDNASSREDRDPFTFKVSWYGGALFCYPDASPYLVNCLFTGNNMNQFDCHGTGSVMYNQQGHPTFEYCTMDDNDASGGFFDMGDYGTLNGPGGVIVSDGGSITLTNCILSGSEASAGVRFIQSSSAELYHNDFFGITGGNFADDIPPGLGVLSTLNANSDSCDVFYNLLLDPVYADAVNGDFHLQELSPCIGAADPLSTISTDFEQNARPRPTGSNPDMGAYESASGGALAAVDDLTIYHDMLNHDIRLFWSPVAAATGYDIYVGADMVNFPANFTLIGTTSDSSYTDDDALLLPDHHRFYVVIATAQP